MSERFYRVTKTGRDAWESQDRAVPADYRRLLWLLDFQGHAGLLREVVAHYPRQALDEWLEELEELGLIEQVPPEEEGGEQFARFGVTLALDEARLAQEAKRASAALARTGAYLALDRIKDRKPWPKSAAETEILIVEDDPDQLTLAKVRVNMAGYKVRTAHSMYQFLQTMFDEGAPDLLLLDVELPDGDGLAILRRLRRHQALADLPVILLTARAAPPEIGQGLAEGADGYLTKPYTKIVLAEAIRGVLRAG